jgi:hypothetical protein
MVDIVKVNDATPVMLRHVETQSSLSVATKVRRVSLSEIASQWQSLEQQLTVRNSVLGFNEKYPFCPTQRTQIWQIIIYDKYLF